MGIEDNNEKNQYILSDLSKEADQERLNDLELTWDSTTIRHMETLGVSAGWKCLDVGAGFGSITGWLSDHVGSQGKVVTTEIRTELHRETSDNVEIRQHNILTDELESDYYDLVHCRLLLQHLGEPEKALSNMAKAVKPGGWLLIEEFDNLILPSFDSNDPDADFYYRFLNKAGQIQIRLRYIDVEFGRNMRRLIDELGFQDVGSEGTTKIVRGGESWARFEVTSYQAIVERLKDVLTEEEKKLLEAQDKAVNLLEDPSFYYVSYPLISSWGRKPN